MASSILHNRKNLSVTVHCTSNATFVIAGNTTVSNVAIGDEVLTGASIKQAWYSSSSGNTAYWTVKRGANTVLVLDSTGWMDFAGNGNLLNKDASANLVLQLVNAADDEGFLMIELQKEGTQATY